ncbi:MAG: hypothetical protein ACYC6L_10935 [Anaerolineae bacterium]
MRCHYSLMPGEILDREHSLLPLLKQAGVDQIWMVDCLSGRPVASDEKVVQAKRILDQHGFDSRGFASVVVGHPGNALNPDDPTLDLTIPPNWRYRVDRHGNPVYFCADIEPQMAADNIAAARRMVNLGFEQFFIDDDFRMGNWGQEIQGCFCDSCLADFSQHLGYTSSRLELSQAIERRDDMALLEEWVGFNCRKIAGLASALAQECKQIGIMVMHHGDERHGLDLDAWRGADPKMLIRVGEMYFSDDGYQHTASKVSELVSIQQHLTCVGRSNSHSETTIFPPRALSPANWVHKMRLTLAAGTENLFFMGGTWIIEENYWQAEISALPGLRQLAVLAQPEHRFPLHIVSSTNGARGEALDPPALPFLAGLPVLPVRGAHIPAGGQILLAFGDYTLGQEWEAALDHYAAIICDEDALQRNPGLTQRKALVLPFRVRSGKPGALEALRSTLEQLKPDYPRLVQGEDICLFWVGTNVLLLNMLPTDNQGVAVFGETRQVVTLPPLAIGYAPIESEALGAIQIIR